MRVGVLAVLTFTLLAAPAMAALGGQNVPPAPDTSTARNFGGLNCPQRVPCPDSWTPGNVPKSSDLADNANNCLVQYFGLTSNGQGFFDRDLGTDSDNCLRNIPGSVKQVGKGNVTPHCCVARLTDNSCSFSCNLLVQ